LQLATKHINRGMFIIEIWCMRNLLTVLADPPTLMGSHVSWLIVKKSCHLMPRDKEPFKYLVYQRVS